MDGVGHALHLVSDAGIGGDRVVRVMDPDLVQERPDDSLALGAADIVHPHTRFTHKVRVEFLDFEVVR